MSLTRVSYTRDWKSSTDFKTELTSEVEVRKDMQALWDQVRDKVNTMIGELESTAGASNIGASSIEGVNTASVQAALGSLKTLIDDKAATTDMNLRETISDANALIKTVSFNPSNGQFTFTTQGGTPTVIDTNLEKVPGSMSLVESPEGSGTYYLVLYDTSEPKQELSRCPVSTLFNPFGVSDTDSVDLTLTNNAAGSKTLSATIKNGGITFSMLAADVETTMQGYVSSARTYAGNAESSAGTAGGYVTAASGYADDARDYADDAIEYAERASSYAGDALNSLSQVQNLAGQVRTNAGVASDSALLSKSWSVGGTGTRAGENTNNAKYWAQQASKVTGADMLKEEYDPDRVVESAGGIPAYVDANGGKIDTIKVNGVEQTITDKVVDLSVLNTVDDVVPKSFGVDGDIFVDVNDTTLKIASSGTIANASRKLGDVDKTGDVTEFDALVIEKYIKGTYILSYVFDRICADVNLDGKVDDEDRQNIIDFVEDKYTIPYTYCNYINDSNAVVGSEIVDLSINGAYAKVFSYGVIAIYSDTIIPANTDITYAIKTSYPVSRSKTISAPFRLVGDINNDDEVDSGDGLSVLRYIAGTSTFTTIQKVCADANFDGVISEDDKDEILRIDAHTSIPKYKYCTYIEDPYAISCSSIVSAKCIEFGEDVFAKVFETGVIAVYSNSKLPSWAVIDYVLISRKKVATEEYVDLYGGKIDKIKVNNVEQAITDKTVNIAVPKAIAFTVQLSTTWTNNTQTVSNANFFASGYAYTVAPSSSDFTKWAEAMIYAENVTTDGQMTFRCDTAPTENITVNILRVEV